jgi:hypothetical protein
VLIVTQNYQPNYKLNNHNIGVWWDGAEWAIFNEDQTTMTTGVSFNVVAQPHNTNFDFIHTAIPTSNHSNYTIMSNALTDGQPSKLVFVTHNWGESSGYMIYNNAPLGVWYTSGQWSIFNENTGLTVKNYETFNVLVQG